MKGLYAITGLPKPSTKKVLTIAATIIGLIYLAKKK